MFSLYSLSKILWKNNVWQCCFIFVVNFFCHWESSKLWIWMRSDEHYCISCWCIYSCASFSLHHIGPEPKINLKKPKMEDQIYNFCIHRKNSSFVYTIYERQDFWIERIVWDLIEIGRLAANRAFFKNIQTKKCIKCETDKRWIEDGRIGHTFQFPNLVCFDMQRGIQV